MSAIIDTASPPGSWDQELARRGTWAPSYDARAKSGAALVQRCRYLATLHGHRDQLNALKDAADELERLYALRG